MPFSSSRTSAARPPERPRRFIIEGSYVHGTHSKPQQDAQLYPLRQFGLPRAETAQKVLDFLNEQMRQQQVPRLYQHVRIIDPRTHLVLSSTPEISAVPA